MPGIPLRRSPAPAILYGVNVGDGEKDTIVRGFWRRICGLFAEQIRKRWLYLIRL